MGAAGRYLVRRSQVQHLARWSAVLALGLALVGCRDSVRRSATDEGRPPAGSSTSGTTAPEGVSARSATPGATATVGEVAAWVNGEPISMEQYRRIALSTQSYHVEQGLDPNTAAGQEQLRNIRRSVLEDLIDQKLIDQAAVELGIVVTDEEVRSSIEQAMADAGGEAAFLESLAQQELSLEEAMAMARADLISRRVFEKVIPPVPEVGLFVRCRHIQCSTREACQKAEARLAAGEAFDAVARELSEDELTRDQGGDLGWVGKGALPSRLAEEAIFALEPGQRSAIVATEYGYHIFEVLERDPNRAIDDEQRLNIWEAEMLRWLADRRRQARIEILIDEFRVTPAPVASP